MRRQLLSAFICLFFSCIHSASAQNQVIDMTDNWTFRKADARDWMPATVPGSVYTDLIANSIIPDPFKNDNEKKVQWVDSSDWIYQHYFFLKQSTLQKKNIDLIFEGLDTYADIYVNDKLVKQADNMFIRWSIPIRNFLHFGQNRISIIFRSAKKITDSIAKAALPLIRPDNNRLYARKAQFQFGWDWGPTLINAGIYKNVWIDTYDERSTLSNIQKEKDQVNKARKKEIKLIEQKDNYGKSFRFEKNGKDIYMKGANWIPADILLTRPNKSTYRNLLVNAKNANMNMLRVWGGGIYESDDFYDLCDSLGIYVWQDFMFAGAMYPGNEQFISSVKEEVRQQILRLRHHPCIVLWCGNNEIDEAWHNWGWQDQFNLHGKDSAAIWHDYVTLFRDSLAKWVKDFDGTRPYISTSPRYGWGHKESFTEGDSHYWGLWWGLEDWETFKTHTGRFVSEYGMQSMPSWFTIENSIDSSERYLYSNATLNHQKANEGFKKLNHYLTRYFIDSATLSTITLKDYTYISQCMQAFILKNVIATHRQQYPKNAGTLLWQLNDCWPVTSWSLIDHNNIKKAAWYAVRSAFADDSRNEIEKIDREMLSKSHPRFTIKKAGDYNIDISSDTDASYVYLSTPDGKIHFTDNYFNIKKGETKRIGIENAVADDNIIHSLSIFSLNDFYQKYPPAK